MFSALAFAAGLAGGYYATSVITKVKAWMAHVPPTK